jgi:hypothetical protein
MFSWFFKKTNDITNDIPNDITNDIPDDPNAINYLFDKTNFTGMTRELMDNCCHGGYLDHKRLDFTHVNSDTLSCNFECYDTVVRYFYTDIKTEDIESVKVMLGECIIDDIKGQWIEVLCKIYNVEVYNSKGYSCIPVGISGLPVMKNFPLNFIIKLKNRALDTKSMYYDTYEDVAPVQESNKFDPILELMDNPKKNGIYNNFRTKQDSLFDNKILTLNNDYNVFYFFLDDPNLEKVDISVRFDPRFDLNWRFDPKKFTLIRKFKNDKYSVFALVDYLKDFEHSINFDACIFKITNITSATESVYVNSCVHRYSNGWFTHNQIK